MKTRQAVSRIAALGLRLRMFSRTNATWGSVAVSTLALHDGLVHDLLVHDPGRGGDDNAGGRHEQAEIPEYAAAREQSDGGDHQRDLQEDFAQMEALGLAAGKGGNLFPFARLGAELFLIVFIAVGFGTIFFLE